MKYILLILTTLVLASCDSSSQKISDIDNRLKVVEAKQATNTGEWILWRSPTCYQCLMTSIPFYAERAFSSENECRNRVIEIGETLHKQVDGINTNSNVMTIAYEKGQDSYYCLPKMIDPRKPKN
jgi:hypothetical protein